MPNPGIRLLSQWKSDLWFILRRAAVRAVLRRSDKLNFYLNCLRGAAGEGADTRGCVRTRECVSGCPSNHTPPVYPLRYTHGASCHLLMLSSPPAITITPGLKGALEGSIASERCQRTTVPGYKMNALPLNWSKTVAWRFKRFFSPLF